MYPKCTQDIPAFFTNIPTFIIYVLKMSIRYTCFIPTFSQIYPLFQKKIGYQNPIFFYASAIFLAISLMTDTHTELPACLYSLASLCSGNLKFSGKP